MEWSRPNIQGVTPGPRAGHAGVTVGDNWYIVGGGNNQTGIFFFCNRSYVERHVYLLSEMFLKRIIIFRWKAWE
jgi:hypothetical protein